MLDGAGVLATTSSPHDANAVLLLVQETLWGKKAGQFVDLGGGISITEQAQFAVNFGSERGAAVTELPSSMLAEMTVAAREAAEETLGLIAPCIGYEANKREVEDVIERAGGALEELETCGPVDRASQVWLKTLQRLRSLGMCQRVVVGARYVLFIVFIPFQDLSNANAYLERAGREEDSIVGQELSKKKFKSRRLHWVPLSSCSTRWQNSQNTMTQAQKQLFLPLHLRLSSALSATDFIEKLDRVHETVFFSPGSSSPCEVPTDIVESLSLMRPAAQPVSNLTVNCLSHCRSGELQIATLHSLTRHGSRRLDISALHVPRHRQAVGSSLDDEDCLICQDVGRELLLRHHAIALFWQLLPSHFVSVLVPQNGKGVRAFRAALRACEYNECDECAIPLFKKNKGEIVNATFFMFAPAVQAAQQDAAAAVWEAEQHHIEQAFQSFKPTDSSQQTKTVRSKVDLVVVSRESHNLSGHVACIVRALQIKLGNRGQAWYAPEEISESWVTGALKNGAIYVYAKERASTQRVVGVGAATLLSDSILAVKFNDTPTIGGYEFTHFVVLNPDGDGTFAGLATVVLSELVAQIKTRVHAGPILLFLDTTFDRLKFDGGGAWKMAARAGEFRRMGWLPFFTGIVCAADRTSYRDNNHLVLYVSLVDA